MEPKNEEESGGLNTKLIEDFIGITIKAFTAVAGVGALLYATGFLVVNINLLSLGAYEVGLLRERFVSAGIIFLATFTFIFFTTIVVSFWIDDGNYAHYYNRFLVNFVGTMIVMLPVIYLVIPPIFLDSDAVGLVTFDTSTFNSLLTYLTRWAVVVLVTLFLSFIVDWLFHFFRPGYSALLFHIVDWTIHQLRSADSAPRSHIDKTIQRLRSTGSARLTQIVDWTIQRLRSAGSALRSLIEAFMERLFGPADPAEAADELPSSKILSIMGFIIKLFLGLFVVIPFLLDISAAWDPSSKEIIIANYYLVYGLLAIVVSLTLIVLDLVNAVIGHSRIAASFKPPAKDGKKRKVLRFGTIIGTMMIMIVAALFLSLISSGLRLENVQETLDHVGVAYEAAGTPGDLQLDEGFEEFYKPLAPRIVAWSLIYGFFLYFLRYAFIPKKTEGDGRAKSVTERATQIIGTFFDRKWPIPYFLLIFFLSLYFFSRDIYAAYPPALGGGLPIVVQFLAKEEHHPRLKQLGIFESDDALTLSPKVDLIAQTGTHYIVLVFDAELNQRTAVSFPKEYVDGVKFSPEEYYLDEQYVAGKRTADGRALLNEGAYEKAIAEFTKALNLTEKSHEQALIGLGDSYVKQAEVDPKSCVAEDCHIEAICNYLEVINKPNVESDGEPIANSFEKADARYQLARALAIFSDKLGDEEDIKSLVTENKEICKERFETVFNDEITEDMVDIRNNLSEAVKLEVSPALYLDKAIKDEAFNDHQYWTDPEFYILFTTMKNAAARYGEEGDLAREAEEMQTAINWYYRALSLVQGFDGSIQAREEEARLRYLLAGVYLDLWEQGSIAEVDIEPILEECEQAETDLQDCTIEKMIINEFNTAVTRDANNPIYRIALAEAHLQFGNYDDAIVTYQGLVDKNASYMPAILGLGDSYRLNSNHRKAMDNFQLIIEQQPDNAAALFGHALATALLHKQPPPSFYASLGIPPRTLDEEEISRICINLRKAINLEPTYLSQAEDEAAFVPFQDCLAAAQEFELGKSLEIQGDVDVAIFAYSEAVSRDPENAAYWAHLANAYQQLKRPSEAEEAYEKAVFYDEDNDEFLHGFGAFYLGQRRYDKAIEKLLAAIDLDDSQAVYYGNLADAYRLRNNEGDLTLAVYSYNRAVELDKEYGDAYCGLGISYDKSDEVEDALAALEVCINKSQNDNLKIEAQKIIDKHPAAEEPTAASDQTEGE